jgi:CHAT domain-containing protein
VADSAPGRSHLLLAADTELRVDAILQQASGRPPSAAGGLVSLAACSSDLAADEYDEALTPATAFLAAGAVTVVGARWQVPDAATAQLMFMFHHFMTRRAYSARDALRSAQLWMLDPARIPPAEMPPELAVSAGRTRMADVTAWAGFVHQGR